MVREEASREGSFRAELTSPGGREPWEAGEGLPHSCSSFAWSPSPASVLTSFLLASSCQACVRAFCFLPSQLWSPLHQAL